MKLLVGLGNPGDQYEATRHNLGFLVLDQFLKDNNSLKDSKWDKNSKLRSEIVLMDWQPKKGKAERIILAKPQTYMNNSGMAVQLLLDYYKVQPSDLWVIHDDLDLPLGKLKIRMGGAAAGHHGVEDIIEKISTDKFWRYRLGIGNSKRLNSAVDNEGAEKVVSRKHSSNVEGYVLGEFIGKEASDAKKMLKDTVLAIEVALENGLESAMNRFNTK